MGIDIDSRLMIGLAYDDLVEGLDEETDAYEWIEELGLDSASPYYDADMNACIYGISVNAWGNTIAEVIQGLNEAAEEFASLTGKQGKVFQSQHVW